MSRMGFIMSCVLFLPALAIAQNPDAQKYAPRPILLVTADKDVEAVMPMVITLDGVQQLKFVPASRIKEFMDHGAQPIRLGDVLSALGEATEKISQLQAENDRLWKVAMKDSPQQPPTVLVQPPAQQQPSPFEKYLLLRSLLQPTQPYQLPPPVNPNANRLKTNCTTRMVGTTSYTDCN